MSLVWLIAGYTLLGLGGSIACLNFYLSFLRNTVHKVWWKNDEPRRVSGFPLVGSLFLVLAAVLLRQSNVWLFLALGFAAMDTGGPHWFLISMLRRRSGPKDSH